MQASIDSDLMNDNVRMQDFSTLQLLCQDCEQRFSIAEKKFAELLFLPFHSKRSRFLYEVAGAEDEHHRCEQARDDYPPLAFLLCHARSSS